MKTLELQFTSPYKASSTKCISVLSRAWGYRELIHREEEPNHLQDVSETIPSNNGQWISGREGLKSLRYDSQASWDSNTELTDYKIQLRTLSNGSVSFETSNRMDFPASEIGEASTAKIWKYSYVCDFMTKLRRENTSVSL